MKNKLPLIILPLLLLFSCERKDYVIPSKLHNHNDIKLQKFTIRTVSKEDAGKTALVFNKQSDADKYVNEFTKKLHSNHTNDSILEFSKTGISRSLLTAIRNGSAVRKLRSNTNAELSADSSTQVVEICTSYYNSSDGSYIGDICTYTIEGGGGTGIGNGANESSGDGTGAYNPAGGGIINGVGTVVGYVPYSSISNLEIIATVDNYNLSTLTSQLTGFTVGSSYSQTSFQQTSVTNGVIHFTLTYSLSLIIFVQSIGTLYTYPNQVVTGTINTNTGRMRITK